MFVKLTAHAVWGGLAWGCLCHCAVLIMVVLGQLRLRSNTLVTSAWGQLMTWPASGHWMEARSWGLRNRGCVSHYPWRGCATQTHPWSSRPPWGGWLSNRSGVVIDCRPGGSFGSPHRNLQQNFFIGLICQRNMHNLLGRCLIFDASRQVEWNVENASGQGTSLSGQRRQLIIRQITSWLCDRMSDT